MAYYLIVNTKEVFLCLTRSLKICKEGIIDVCFLFHVEVGLVEILREVRMTEDPLRTVASVSAFRLLFK